MFVAPVFCQHFSLGRGEAEAIALALDEKAQIAGIDPVLVVDADDLGLFV